MSDPYHWTNDVLELLVKTVSTLHWSKDSLMAFFDGAGVPEKYTIDFKALLFLNKNDVKKAPMSRKIMQRIQRDGDATLPVRREVVSRIYYWRDYAATMPEQIEEAKGLVARVKDLVDEVDGPKRAQRAAEEERNERLRAQLKREDAKNQARLEREKKYADLESRFMVCQGMDKRPQKRGILLEGILNEYFALEKIGVHEPFKVDVQGLGTYEQIDGAVEIFRQLYLVEMKWWKQALSPQDIAWFIDKVTFRPRCSGLLIVNPGVTPAAIELCTRTMLKDKLIIICSVHQLFQLLRNRIPLELWLHQRATKATLETNPNPDQPFAIDERHAAP